MKKPTLTLHNALGEPETVELPYTLVICSHCRGEGTSSAYLGAYTREDMDEVGPEFEEAYMAGEYDRPCEHCEGTGRVAVADRSRMTADQIEALDDEEESRRELAAAYRMERMMGA